MITPPWWPIYFGFCEKIEILYKIVHFVFFLGFTAFLAQIVYFSCMLTWILWQVRAFMNIPPLLTHIFWVSGRILSIRANFRYFLLFMRVFFNVRTHRTWFTTLFILCHISNNATQFSHLALKDCVYPDIQSFSPSGIPILRGTLLAVNQHLSSPRSPHLGTSWGTLLANILPTFRQTKRSSHLTWTWFPNGAETL